MTDAEYIKQLEAKVAALEAELYERDSTMTDSQGNKYPVRNHPRWRGKKGNPYLPLDKDGNMQQGYVG